MWTPHFDGQSRHSGRKFFNLGKKYGPRKRLSESGDPVASFYFNLEVSGITICHFQEVSGLTWETEILSHKEGGLNDYEHKLMGQTKFSNLVLKNGMTNSRDLWNWRMKVLSDPASARKDGSVVLLGFKDGSKFEIQRWNFFRGWPVKWDGPQLSGTANAIAIETVEIAYDRLEVG